MIQKLIKPIRKYIYYIFGVAIIGVVFLGSYLILSLSSGGESIQSEILQVDSLNEQNIDDFDIKKDYDLDFIEDLRYSQKSSKSEVSSISSASSISSSRDNSGLIEDIDKVIGVIDNLDTENIYKKELEKIELD